MKLESIELIEYVGKKVKIQTITGDEYIGKAIGFTQALDNEPEVDELDIEGENEKVCYAILKTEIASIEVIE